MSDLLVTRDGAVLEIRLNRPAKKNALTNDMYRVAADALAAADQDDAVRAVLFSAEGDFFTSGNDIKDFAAQSAGAFEGPRHVARFLENLVMAQTPIVAAVQGHAVGVGTTMLLHCDLVFIAEDARLTTPFVDLGLVPENASSLTLPARLGHVRAFAMLGLCEPLSGRDAALFGLANKAAPTAEVLALAKAGAAAIASKPPEAMRITKALMRDRNTLIARLRHEGELFSERLKSPEAAQAFAAFLKR